MENEELYATCHQDGCTSRRLHYHMLDFKPWKGIPCACPSGVDTVHLEGDNLRTPCYRPRGICVECRVRVVSTPYLMCTECWEELEDEAAYDAELIEEQMDIARGEYKANQAEPASEEGNENVEM